MERKPDIQKEKEKEKTLSAALSAFGRKIVIDLVKLLPKTSTKKPRGIEKAYCARSKKKKKKKQPRFHV